MHDRLYDVTIEYLGMKKKDTFKNATICLGKEGEFMVMDSMGKHLCFMADHCRVEQIAAHVIIITGYTNRTKPKHITAYCVYKEDHFENIPEDDYDELIRKLTEIAHKSEKYHKEWVTLEMEETGCSRDEAEKRFTITQMERKQK